MNQKKIIAAIVAALLAFGGALGAGVTGLQTAGETSERVRVLEVQRIEDAKRLERIENKLDELLKEWRR